MDVNKAIIDKLATFLPDDKKPIMERLGDDLSKLMSGDPTFKPKTWKGYRFYPGFEPESAKHMYDDKKFEENCVAVCTFAKTGTTWVMQIVYNILYGHDEKLDKIAKLLIQPVTYFEFMKAYKYEATDHIPLPRRVYGTHLAAELVNVEKIKKAKGKVLIDCKHNNDTLPISSVKLTVRVFPLAKTINSGFWSTNELNINIFTVSWVAKKTLRLALIVQLLASTRMS